MATPQIIATALQITPDPLQPNFVLLIQRDNKKGVMGIYQSTDGGVTFKLFLPAPGAQDRVGSIPVIQSDGSVLWQQVPALLASTVPKTLQFVDMLLSDTVYLNATFGFLRIPAGYNFRCRELQISMQTASDTNLTIDLINGNGAVQNVPVTLAAAAQNVAASLQSAISMPALSTWGLKVLACGTTYPGENLSVRLVLESL